MSREVLRMSNEKACIMLQVDTLTSGKAAAYHNM